MLHDLVKMYWPKHIKQGVKIHHMRGYSIRQKFNKRQKRERFKRNLIRLIMKDKSRRKQPLLKRSIARMKVFRQVDLRKLFSSLY